MSLMSILGVEGAIANLLGIAAESAVVIPEAERKAAEPILQGAQERVPVLSGDLKGTLRIEEREGHAAVVAGDDTVDYAVFVEFAPDNEPFLRPAADDAKDETVKTISDAVAVVIR
jgi:hypothetical protein